MIAHGLRPTGSVATRSGPEEDTVRVPKTPTPGRSLVTGRAIVDIVRAATLGSYGVTGFAAGPFGRLLERVGLARPGIRLAVGPRLEIDLDLTVAYGLPVAEVARQVESAVRYAVRRAIDRDVDRLTIHIDGLRLQAGGAPPTTPTATVVPAAGPAAAEPDPVDPDVAAPAADRRPRRRRAAS
jgi:uncharacterized alkaline shock family protein YloU